ncbi:MAG: cupin domain-containing protein [bacterium]|nr:cupin domain-containing protein [bacterium]
MGEYQVRDLSALADEALAALEEGGRPGFPLIEGRVLAVQVTPERGTSSDIAIGVAALPSGFSTPDHTHRAEEIATVLRGSGSITIEGTTIDVTPGSVVVTPPYAHHVTTAGPDGPMVVFWMYAPAGSEQRWLAQDRD